MTRWLLFGMAVIAVAQQAAALARGETDKNRVRRFRTATFPRRCRRTKNCSRRRPDLKGKINLSFLTESVFDDAKVADFTGADVLVLDTMNQQMVDRFDTTHKVDLLKAVKSRGKVLAVGEGLLPKQHYIDLGAEWNDEARTFWANSGSSNQLGLMKLTLSEAKPA